MASMFSGRPIVRNIIGQAQTTIDFRKAIENREVILIKLPIQTLPYDSRLIGVLLVAAIHEAVFSFSNLPESQRPGFSLYVDEFQTFASEDFTTMLTQARKYGARITIANQFMSQLPGFLQDAVKGVHTKVCFRLNHDDARTMSPYYETSEVVVREQDMTREPVRHLLHHETGNRNVQTFTDWYIRHLQTVERQNGRIVIEKPGYRVEHLGYHLTNTEPPKDKLKEDDPTHDLNYLLREVMRTGDFTIPIPSQIVFGFANAGRGFYAYCRYHPIGGLLKANYQFPKHLVAEQNGYRYWNWNRTPEDSREQLLHFLFHLRETMRYVAYNPLGTATAVGASDIASMLTQLPKRAAFVRSGDDVGVIYTDDTLAACDEEEFEARLTQVKVQTIQKYCREVVPQLPGIPANPQPAKPQFRRYTEVI
jgi:hypothetical protein